MTDSPRIVAYLRQSERRPGEDERTSLSLRGQEERAMEYAKRVGGTIIRTITDHDLRGWDATRPGIKELIATVRNERVDIVWLFSMVRLSKDLILQLMICRDLEKAGVAKIVTELEGPIDDPFIRGLYGLMGEKSTRETSLHLRASFARRARDGGFPTGRTPMGYARPHTITIHRANGTSYERQTGEPVIDPEGAAFIRSIFDRFDAGDSLHAIANDLAATGPGPRGGVWSRSSLRALLSAPIYAGDIAHKGVVVAHNDAWAIVPRDQWERVQARLNRLTVVRRDERDSWLEGLVDHACGSRMYFQRYTGHSAGHGGMFVCRHYASPPRCTLPRTIIGKDLLETAVRQCLLTDLRARRTPTEATRIAQERAGGAQAVRSRAAIDKRLRAAQARWERYDGRFGAGKISGDRMDEEDALLAVAKAEHARAIANLPAPPDPLVIERLADRLHGIASVIARASDARLSALLDELGRVVVSCAGVRIAYVPAVEPLIESHTICVPKGGRGLR